MARDFEFKAENVINQIKHSISNIQNKRDYCIYCYIYKSLVRIIVGFFGFSGILMTLIILYARHKKTKKQGQEQRKSLPEGVAMYYLIFHEPQIYTIFENQADCRIFFDYFPDFARK